MTALLRLAVTPTRATRLRRFARAWVVVVLVLIAALAIYRRVTAEATAQDWEPLAWTAAVLAVALAAVAMWWSDGLTGAWLGMLGVISGVGLASQYGVWAGLIPVAAAFPGAAGFVLAWQHPRTRRALFAFLLGLGLLLAGGGAAAWAAQRGMFGPTHPESSTPAADPSPVVWMWSGAVTTDGFTVVAEVDHPGAVELRVASAQGETVATVPGLAVGDPAVARLEVTGLAAATDYRYAVWTQTGAGPVGRARTFPAGPASLTIAFSSCARLGSNGAVFDAIAATEPDLYLITGDWFYADIVADDPEAFRAAYRRTLTAPAQAALYRQVPIAYVWDDHDFGRNDAGAGSLSRPAAMAIYRELVPHYPLAGEDTAIYQSFTTGRVRVLMMDTRSSRTADGMLGTAQSDWLHEQLRAAAAHDELVLLVSSVPWITPEAPGADDWGGYPGERAQIAAEIKVSGAAVVLLAGDAHMVAIDDGTNNDYTYTPDSPGFVVFHAGALDRPGSLKGGPYSEGALPGGGQFGLVEITDDGQTMTVTLRGLDWKGSVLVEHTFTVKP